MVEKNFNDSLYDSIFFKKICYFNSLESTNKKLIELIKKTSQPPDVVLAEEQTGGKGRRGNRWFSPYGGLWMSVILPDIISAQDITMLSIASGLSCAKACDTIIKASRISKFHTFLRWPNDLILDNRKLGGLLLEVKKISVIRKTIILGVGINVNVEAFPEELKKLATSLLIVTKNKTSMRTLISYILKELDITLMNLKKNGIDCLLKEWEAYSYEIGKNIEITSTHNEKKRGKVLGIGRRGELILVKNNNSEVVLNGYDLKILDK